MHQPWSRPLAGPARVHALGRLQHGARVRAWECRPGGAGEAKGKARLVSSIPNPNLKPEECISFDAWEEEPSNHPEPPQECAECWRIRDEAILRDPTIMKMLESANRQYEEGKAIPLSKLMKDLGSKRTSHNVLLSDALAII